MALGLGWPVHVALPPRPHARYEALKDLNVELRGTDCCSEGMGGSLRESIASLPSDTSAALLLLADLPDLTLEDLTRVVASRDANPEAAIWRGSTTLGAPGHPILFARETFPAFADLQGDDGGKAVIAAFADRMCFVPLPGDRARRDLDTPEDWAEWRSAQQQ